MEISPNTRTRYDNIHASILPAFLDASCATSNGPDLKKNPCTAIYELIKCYLLTKDNSKILG